MSKRSIRRLRGYGPRWDLESIVERIYKRSPVGCCMHIVFDDHNLERSHVEFCKSLAVENDCLDCELAADRLLAMSDDLRAKTVRRVTRGL